VLSSIGSVQVGAAIAKNLFGTVSPTTLVWFRLLTSAVVLLLIVRLGVRGHSRRDWLIALAFGVCLVSMNWAIYQAYARIPLGIAVTIEFLGPLAVAVIGSKRLADLVWVLARAAERAESRAATPARRPGAAIRRETTT